MSSFLHRGALGPHTLYRCMLITTCLLGFIASLQGEYAFTWPVKGVLAAIIAGFQLMAIHEYGAESYGPTNPRSVLIAGGLPLVIPVITYFYDFDPLTAFAFQVMVFTSGLLFLVMLTFNIGLALFGSYLCLRNIHSTVGMDSIFRAPYHRRFGRPS